MLTVLWNNLHYVLQFKYATYVLVQIGPTFGTLNWNAISSRMQFYCRWIIRVFNLVFHFLILEDTKFQISSIG